MINWKPRPDDDAVLVADLHLHETPPWRARWCSSFVQALLRRAYTYKDAPPLILVGDVFENRNRIDAEPLNQMITLCVNWPSDVYWITGQHDSHSPQIASVQSLGKIAQVAGADMKRAVLHAINVVDDGPMHLRLKRHDVCLIPYARDPDVYRGWLDEAEGAQTLITHMPVAEVLEKYGARPPVSAIKLNDLERFDLVISGDIHHGQTVGNVVYLGAPGQRDWRDAGVRGCIGLINGDGLQRREVRHPVHVTLTPKEAETWQPDPGAAGILVKVKGNVDREVIERLRATSPAIITVLWEPDIATHIIRKGGIRELAEVDDLKLIEEYVKKAKLPDWIEPEDVTEFGREFIGA